MKKTLINTVLLVAGLMAASGLASAQTAQPASYEVRLTEAAARAAAVKGFDEPAEAVRILTDGAASTTAGEILARMKGSLPASGYDQPIRLLPSMSENLVREGKEYQRLAALAQPVLKLLGLEGRVRPLLYRWEAPIVAHSWPNAVIVSTRAMSLLSDDELQAQLGHELFHLVGRKVFTEAVDAKNERVLRLIELFCDGGGAAVMTSLGKDPRKLVSGLSKMQGVLEVEFGENFRKGRNPTLKDRKKLTEELAARLGQVATK